MLQFLDKQSLNFASIMGIITDLVGHILCLSLCNDSTNVHTQDLTGSRYSWCSSIFYFGYLIFSYPASFLMVRLPLGKYLAGTR